CCCRAGARQAGERIHSAGHGARIAQWRFGNRSGAGPRHTTGGITPKPIPAQAAQQACEPVPESEEMTMDWRDRITVDPQVLVGKPIVRGTRLSVEFIIGLFAQGWIEAQVLENYPRLTHDDIVACFAYASERLAAERVYPLAG